MMKSNKLLIWETIIALIVIGLIVCIFMVDLDLGVFKIVPVNKLLSQYTSIKDLDTKLQTTKSDYESSIKSVEDAKTNYEKQKTQYDAISEDTINIIKEATADEQYTIDYIWVKIGNYATSNNLVLSLVEPGGTASASSSSTGGGTTTPTGTTGGNTQVSSGTTTGTGTTTPTGTTTGTDTAPTTNTPPTTNTGTSSSDELSIKVVGNYTDVSSFIFDLENDNELRFKLDKIKMEYAGSNQITATFAVRNLKFVK